MQRHKVKFKFAIDDHSQMGNPIVSLRSNLYEYGAIMKMYRKTHNKQIPGPLLEKKFL